MTAYDDIRPALAEHLRPRDHAADSFAIGIGLEDLSVGREYLETAAANGGWAVPTWPTEYGGRSATPAEAAEISRALQEFETPDLYAFSAGIALVGPCVLEWGTPEQKERWIRPIATGAEVWCQLFSEPDAGSDLANVRTRAIQDGDEWILDGQKVWTSRATWAKWGICLARTDPDVPKHDGLTMFAVDMTSLGVEVRPLRQINGDEHFSKVFLREVRVPDADRMGPVGQGWSVTRSVISAEHQIAGKIGGQAMSWERPGWLADLADRGVLDDAVWRDRALRAYCLELSAKLVVVAGREAGPPPGLAPSGGSGGKLREVARYKSVSYMVKDSYGAAGLLDDHDGHLEFLTAPSLSIRGGTDEIQRGIVGDRSLKLPAEPRPPKDQPWSQSDRGGQ